MHLISLVRAAFAGSIAHHSRHAVSSHRPPPHLLSTTLTTLLRLLVLLTLPLTLLSLLLIYLSHLLPPLLRRRRRTPPSPSPQHILLTTTASPPATALALSLARTLHSAGHTITLATTAAPSSLPSPATFSSAVTSAPLLRHTPPTLDPAATYEHDVLGAILTSRPTLWLPCEPFAAAPSSLPPLLATIDQLRDTLTREAHRPTPRARCAVLAPTGAIATLVRDRAAFVEFAASLGTGVVPVAKAAVVRTRWEVHQALHEARRAGRTDKRFVLERLGGSESERVVVPLGSSMNETYDVVAGLDISRARPWAMWERVEGEVYRAHVVVVRGAVRAFAVARAEGRAARVFVAAGSALHAAFLGFVEAFVAGVPEAFSAPLAIDFVVRTGRTEAGTASRIHPMGCVWDALPIAAAPFPAAMLELVEQNHLAVATTKTRNGAEDQKAPRFVHGTTTPPDSPALKAVGRFVASNAPLTPPSSPARSAVSPRQKVGQEGRQAEPLAPSPSSAAAVLLPPSVTGVYSLPHTVLAYLVVPVLRLLGRPSRSALAGVVRGYAVVVDRVLLPRAWVEELWDGGDAGPWVWEWGVRQVLMAPEGMKG